MTRLKCNRKIAGGYLRGDSGRVQYGGGPPRRLLSEECPLGEQERVLRRLGWWDAGRRARLGIDPWLQHALRFRTGPAASPCAAGLARAGPLLVLKGLVFPQWRRRHVAVLPGRLLIFPATDDGTPEQVVLSGGSVSERPLKAGRLVLRVEVPQLAAARESAATNTATIRHIFLGFDTHADRDLWREWLEQATEEAAQPSRLDVSGGALESLPAALLCGSSLLELDASRNRLRDLEALAATPCCRGLRALSLAHNELAALPPPLLRLDRLALLDLSSNCLRDLPDSLRDLQQLQELRLDRNQLVALPACLSQLPRLRALWAAHNLLSALPPWLSTMRALSLLDVQGNRVEGVGRSSGGDVLQQQQQQLGRLVLRENLLKGRIVLADYGNLTQLDVSENNIETLDLSALSKLENVQCSRNQLVELTVNGKSLTSLIAGNNALHKLTISPPPVHLMHLDVSYNELEMLPNWIPGCNKLRALFASHNKLHSLPEHMFCSDLTSLQTLQLSYNQLSSLPSVIGHLQLQELFLQSNSIAMLPSNFFMALSRLRVLNISNNRLCELPSALKLSDNQVYEMEKLYLTANCLTDNSLEIIAKFINLRILHAAYNCLTRLPESCISAWKDLEELILSGNKLQYLPDNITQLEHLRVLRVHSNRLYTSPCFAKMSSLKVLDLAHNQLDRINLATLVPNQLQFLDLSCNSRLYVDPRQFQVYRTQRPMSLVDVSGHNRTSLPSTPYNEGNGELDPPWKIGFSEAAGSRERLYISQIRLPAFCNTEGLFGMFDGGNTNELPVILTKAVPRILLEERTVKETANEYMKYTMLSAHRELKEKGQKNGVCATLCHITKMRGNSNQSGNGFIPSNTRYVMRVASVGEAKAVLCRQSEGIVLAQKEKSKATGNPNNTKQRSQLGCSAMYPLVIPDPCISEIVLEEHDEFLIIANKGFWEVISVSEAVEEVRHVSNAILAAKKLQDMAQSYGCDENISIIVVRFYNLGSDMDHLMRELRHTIGKTKQRFSVDSDNDVPVHTSCQRTLCRSQAADAGCCCCQSVPDHFYGTECNLRYGNNVNNECTDSHILPETDRSSPSGQSDHANSDYVGRKVSVAEGRDAARYTQQWNSGVNRTMPFSKGKFQNTVPHQQSVLMHENGTKKISAVGPTIERRSYRDSRRSNSGVLKAIRAKVDMYSNGHLADGEEDETSSEKSGTQLSEEQFKCWEYMLEQNTQLLFDKELDTLSRGFVRNCGLRAASSATLLDPSWPQHATSSFCQGKGLSHSSPHLSDSAAPSGSIAPFLSRHFGSARSFNPISRSNRFGSCRQTLNGGPNAAYFGSLQRLMPYNLEYNFAVIQERGANQDSLETDSRMQKYWDVATTEL
ncbi:protein phosphatase PHLPP-like protein [Schistocerca nitens]|uniref:protein phosphatase PHLPP-like protein n=1 Tax=Schistocerca nitens TaxID=7011 RepID=UPI0021182701|nr:protein phosphatase PHLPP-like protein [Schistocerca nitens]